MLEFKQNDTAVKIILTLSELALLVDPNFLFTFKHVTTKEVVAFIKSTSDDESDYPARYNQFTINASALFAGKPVGEWHYSIYEQESPSNLDSTQATHPLEYGKMKLERAQDFSFSEYDSPTTYTVYNG